VDHYKQACMRIHSAGGMLLLHWESTSNGSSNCAAAAGRTCCRCRWQRQWQGTSAAVAAPMRDGSLRDVLEGVVYPQDVRECAGAAAAAAAAATPLPADSAAFCCHNCSADLFREHGSP